MVNGFSDSAKLKKKEKGNSLPQAKLFASLNRICNASREGAVLSYFGSLEICPLPLRHFTLGPVLIIDRSLKLKLKMVLPCIIVEYFGGKGVSLNQ